MRRPDRPPRPARRFRLAPRRLVVLLPAWAWLALFVAAPALVLLGIALGEYDTGVPPFRPPLGPGGAWQGTLANFAAVATDPFYRDGFLRSLLVAFATAALCLLVGYPMALAMARAPEARRTPLLLAVLLPFWTGFLIRVGAWIGLLRDEGWLNGVLRALGVIGEPLPLLYSDLAMYVGMVHAYLPFAVLPLYAALARRDPAVEEAAADLGARPAVVFVTVTLPLSAPGAAAAFLLVFIPAAGEFVIPDLLGPPEAQLVGRMLWGEFFQNRDWPLAAALAVALLAVLILPVRLFQRLEAGR
ncbi:polyamine transporter PotH [Caldovatus sediminis]|uniref:Polyamine transporter PotH n=1 Tax=Caldovatus sediminis TaxID=2041189 RepID=A0A8J2Z900_9PROT|nr:ABC transporter permease subunit [Caldovatus sediminis]GGG22372.1 polyamine transporter PotH [Caldovatus sediminis]